MRMEAASMGEDWRGVGEGGREEWVELRGDA